MRNIFSTKNKEVSLHFVAKVAMILSKLSIWFFVLLIYCEAAISTIISPYNYYFVGIGCCFFVYTFFRIVRVKTYRLDYKKYDVEQLTTKDNLLYKLMIELNLDINKFENASSYFFSSVSSYKYNTAILSGISTVILGLDLNGITLPFPISYTLLSKNVALVLGAIITVMSTMAIYWNIEKYWLQNKIILQRFKQLREEVEFADKKNVLTAEQISEFCERYEKIKYEFYKYWEGVQAERNKQ